jgi:hypothetical protein
VVMQTRYGLYIITAGMHINEVLTHNGLQETCEASV